MLYGIASAASALLLTAVLTALLRAPAVRLGLVERRRGRVVPLLGGLAVTGGTALVALGGEWTGVAPLGEEAAWLLAGGCAVALLGLVADVRRVPAVVQTGCVAGVAAVALPYEEWGAAGAVAAVALTVLLTFAFASLDHADGVLGAVGAVTAFALGGCAAAAFYGEVAALLGVLAAALTGFLVLGRPPARVVPGRCGALFVGFVLASTVVLVHADAETGWSGPAAVFALTAVATADAVLVLVSRRRAARPLLRAAPDHVVHRLRRLGVTPGAATVAVGVAALAGAVMGLLIDLGRLGPTAVWWVAGAAGIVVLGLVWVPVYRPGVGRPRRPYGTPSGRSAAPRPYDRDGQLALRRRTS
ncbi:hypothetical protein SGFS_064860 [Streptomyces graminofaciens]|uniref:Undecaprenyl/decaprenyl-phosphate alpha-N-acetylglucosaminyl 1-phosphate transferase n=1 Tax=Streptomyces graminofaciens TaxID=68212 RepID=A0ABN5VSZ0_9ACTN|nr:undecaprenyl/decaprenyl-phosphate alpha-N-acetylglucosaminyl 1-phosphate transferase [Streptomyces graminofaciens]BBC35192.1 hypothetical protein SGFS_064860 [Streptomyces graminofaciens]